LARGRALADHECMNRLRGLLSRVLLLSVLASVTTLAAACGGSDPGFVERIEDPFAGGYPIYRDEDSGVRVIVGTPDLGVGEQRVSFALFAPPSEEGGMLVISQPELTVRAFRYPSGHGGDRVGPIDEVVVRFGELPPGERGIHRGTFQFEEA